MNRRTAIAAAVAVTMSLTSGVVAWSANAGALGFGASNPAVATQSVVASGARGAQPAAANSALRGGENDDGARSAQVGADHTTTARGEHND